MSRVLVALSVMLAFCASQAFPQTFNAASVRVGIEAPRTQNRISGGPGTSDPTHFSIESVPLVSLMMRAWHLQPDQISGPDWVKKIADPRTLYTVRALVPAGSSAEQLDIMLRNLLEDRFHLTFHREAKEFAGYELVVADDGAKIRPCISEGDAGKPGTDGRKPCVKLPAGGMKTTSLSGGVGAWGTIRQRHMTSMADFAESLGTAINETNGLPAGFATPRVTDKTGLTGTYEFSLEFAGVVLLAGMQSPDPVEGADAGPTLFSALENQLGLKLVKTKDVPVDIFVIDYANKVPTEN